jgi:hypothetical protein
MSVSKFELGTSRIQGWSIIPGSGWLGTDLSLSSHPDVLITDVSEASDPTKIIWRKVLEPQRENCGMPHSARRPRVVYHWSRSGKRRDNDGQAWTNKILTCTNEWRDWHGVLHKRAQHERCIDTLCSVWLNVLDVRMHIHQRSVQ